jgi:CubicO group peptidase (beta-lactamase class C family)
MNQLLQPTVPYRLVDMEMRAAMTIVSRLALAMLAAAGMMSSTSYSMSAQTKPVVATDLVGIWGSEEDFGPRESGSLTIDARPGTWLAKIAGYEVPVSHTGHAVAFRLPNDRGEFRGRLEAHSQEISGEWIQAKFNVSECCRLRYASPVNLKRVLSGWRGEVTPLKYRASLYLVINRPDDGSLSAFIRNPEANIGTRRPFTVILKDNVITLANDKDKDDVLIGEYRPDPERISFQITEYGAVFDFARRNKDQAIGFYTRTPAQAAYSYRQPIKEDDGWRTASLKEVGLSKSIMSQLVQEILDTQTTDWQTPYIQSLLVARHGKLVLEEYFYGFGKDRPHDTRSAGKSLTTTLLGIAIDKGARVSPDTSVSSLFPEYQPFGNPDPRKSKILVRNLLTMTSGLDCDDDSATALGREGMILNHGGSDWYKYTLNLPMVTEPDSRIGNAQSVYCTAGINLIGGIVRDTMHTSVVDFFDKNYARPMDIHQYYLDLMPDGDYYGGGGSYIRPRDWMKLGQLYVSGGLWNGRRVLSKSWVNKATTKYGTQNEPDHGYGYGLHLYQFLVEGHTYHVFEAEGNGGQIVAGIPDLDMVICFSAGNYQNGATWNKFSSQLIPKYFIPAALDEAH